MTFPYFPENLRKYIDLYLFSNFKMIDTLNRLSAGMLSQFFPNKDSLLEAFNSLDDYFFLWMTPKEGTEVFKFKLSLEDLEKTTKNITVSEIVKEVVEEVVEEVVKSVSIGTNTETTSTSFSIGTNTEPTSISIGTNTETNQILQDKINQIETLITEIKELI